MIIEQLRDLGAFISAKQPYFDKAFIDARMIVDADRQGIFVIDENGEHEAASMFDFNSFYLRRTGPTVARGGNLASGLLLETPTRLIAQARGVDPYKFADCLISTIVTKCAMFDFKSIEFNPHVILRNEGLGPMAIKAAMMRLRDKHFIQIDFSMIETYSPTDVVNCACNPCKPC